MSRSVCRSSREYGFTLIELLVVVSIIALLISILLPSMQNARRQAQAVMCMAAQDQITKANLMYKLDFNGYLPGNCWSEAAWGLPKKDLWFYKLFPKYCADGKLFICPGDPFRKKFDFDAWNKATPDPTDRLNEVASCGYGMNYLMRHMPGNPFFVDQNPSKRPAETILLVEVGPDDQLVTCSLGSSNEYGVPWRDGGRTLWDDAGTRSWYTIKGTGRRGPTWITGRHNGKITISALDGHIQLVRTSHMLKQPLKMVYDDCKAGDCYLCNYHNNPFDQAHYNFAHARLWWWIGKRTW